MDSYQRRIIVNRMAIEFQVIYWPILYAIGNILHMRLDTEKQFRREEASDNLRSYFEMIRISFLIWISPEAGSSIGSLVFSSLQ